LARLDAHFDLADVLAAELLFSMHDDHIIKRETPTGRWVPAAFYVINLFGWTLTGAMAGAWELVWLVVLPLPPLIIYLARMHR
jgi:hypothetical protein